MLLTSLLIIKAEQEVDAEFARISRDFEAAGRRNTERMNKAIERNNKSFENFTTRNKAEFDKGVQDMHDEFDAEIKRDKEWLDEFRRNRLW